MVLITHVAGGYRDFGKTKTRWSKSFNASRHISVVRPRLTHKYHLCHNNIMILTVGALT